MEQETQAALMQVIRDLQEEMKNMRQDLGERMTRIEQRPPLRPPIRVNVGTTQPNPTPNGTHVNEAPEASNARQQCEYDPGPYYPPNNNPRRAGVQDEEGEEEEEDYAPLPRARTNQNRNHQGEEHNPPPRVRHNLNRFPTEEDYYPPPRVRPNQNQYQDEEDYNPPPRQRQPQNQYQNHIKLKAPVYAGKVDPEAYLDWEKRMDHIFEYYNHPGPKRVALAVAQLTDNALVWWDRVTTDRRRNQLRQLESWLDMKDLMRQRFVPQHFHRDLQKRFRTLKQGTKSVEEYYEEFERLRNRLGLNEDEESNMAQFIDGLQDRISSKVERQNYQDFKDLFHLAIQAEQHIKKKTSRNKSQTTWGSSNNNNNYSKPVDKGKGIDLGVQNKNRPTEQSKDNRADQNKAPNPQRTRDITCFKCKGRGHMARDCPNQRVMLITEDGGYESQDEAEAECQ